VRSRKRNWFDRGVQAFARVTKGTLPEGYLCPLCYEGDGKPFTLYLPDALNMELLSEEDVPPRSIGGRRIVLTCKDCNCTAGHTIDAELRKMENVNDFWGRRLPRNRACSIEIDVLKVNAHAIWENGKLLLTNYARVNAPSSADQMTGMLDRIAEAQRTDWEFKLTLEQDAWKRGWA